MEKNLVSASLTGLFERFTPRIFGSFTGCAIVNTAIVFVAILMGNPPSFEPNLDPGWRSSLVRLGTTLAVATIASLCASWIARQTHIPRESGKKAQRPGREGEGEEPPPGNADEGPVIRETSPPQFDRLLLETIRAIENAPDFESALETTLVQICQSAGWDYGEVWVPSADGQALQNHPACYIRPDAPLPEALEEFRQYSEGLTFLPSEGLPGQVWTHRQADWIENLAIEPSRVYLREPLARQCGFKAVLGIPLFAGPLEGGNDSGGSVLAIALFFILEPRPSDRHLVRFWSAVSPHLGAIVAQKSLHAEFQAYLAATTDVMLVIDAQGYCLKIAPTQTSPAFQAAHGEVGRSLQDIFDAERARTFIGYIWQALRTKETVRVEYPLTVPAVAREEQSQNVIWFSAAISPITEDAVIWIARDITECKRVERTLQEQQTYLRLVLDNIPQQVFWKDTNLVFRGCNKNWAKSAHLERAEDAVGKTDYDLLPSREIADFFRARDRQTIESNSPQLHAIISKQRPGEDGKAIWLDVSRIPMQDAEGNTIGVIGVLEDITQRKEAEEALRREQAKSERLLLNVLPREIAARLKEEEGAIASAVDEATVLFADIVGFTSLSDRLSATELVDLLNQIFSEFDRLAETHGLEKIKTIGDAYMVAGGIPLPHPNSAAAIAQMALDMQQAIARFRTDREETFQIRIGINTGPVVAGVIGIKKFIYDLWGDTVNVASRMESTGVPGGIQVTESTYEKLKTQYRFESRGPIEIKGKGQMKTYWLVE